ncbi:MAG: dTMP kinase [Chloroflexi bacterium]|nr:MAG: dTMP kinase [Chloroflexota bacterium]
MSLFITFEGPEGSGKSTQARRLYERLAAASYPVIVTREPGGTPISDLIRRIVLDLQHSEMVSTTETLLFSAARAQHVAERIQPYLALGGIVVCDRFADSMLAYQGFGSGQDLDELRTLTRIATGGLRPDITFYLDLPAQEGLDRKRKAAQRPSNASPLSPRPPEAGPQEWNRLDARDLAYHERVRSGFLELVKLEPERWQVLDAHLSMDELSARIWHVIEPRLSGIRPLEDHTA